MQELIAQVFSYIWGIWRYRWLALAVAWVLAIVGWLFVQRMPEAYVASSRVYVDTNNLLRPLLRGLAIQPDTEQRIAMMSRTLLSRPNLEKVMRMTDLDLQVQTDRDKENMLEELRESINLSGDRTNTSLYAIGVRHENPAMAKQLTQALITVFIESGLSDKRESSSGAQSFLDDQIDEYEQRLIEAENRLAEFKQRHVDVLSGDGGGYYANLNNANAILDTARLELQELENRRDALQRQIDGEEPMFLSSGSGPASSPLDGRIQALNAQMDSLLAKYTDKHPEVRQIKGLIRSLEREKRTEMEQTMAGGGSAFVGLSSNPVYQGMRSMLAETDARIAELIVRVEEYERRVEELRGKVDDVPKIEADLKQLDRDYGVIEAKHRALLERREAARLSQDVEQNASDVTFRVIDPPFVPSKPSEPNKLLLNSVVLVLALGAGAGLALLVSLVKPVVVDPQSLARLTGLPMFGSITLIPTPEQKKKEAIGLATYSSLFVVLILAYVGINIGQVMALS